MRALMASQDLATLMPDRSRYCRYKKPSRNSPMALGRTEGVPDRTGEYHDSLRSSGGDHKAAGLPAVTTNQPSHRPMSTSSDDVRVQVISQQLSRQLSSSRGDLSRPFKVLFCHGVAERRNRPIEK
ncbi:hypothetical protein BDW62DRAFT_50756 [Aspergillus aurantiobrunneus]